VPRSIISFGFKDFEEGFKIKTTLNMLSNITGRIKDFFLKARVGAGIGTATGVFGVVEIAGVLKIIGVLEIAGAVETGAVKGVGLEASSCARHNKTVS
jgi:hypothetical protein